MEFSPSDKFFFEFGDCVDDNFTLILILKDLLYFPIVVNICQRLLLFSCELNDKIHTSISLRDILLIAFTVEYFSLQRYQANHNSDSNLHIEIEHI